MLFPILIQLVELLSRLLIKEGGGFTKQFYEASSLYEPRWLAIRIEENTHSCAVNKVK